MQNKVEVDKVDGFMCICSPEGKTEAETILAEVKELLEADDSNVITNIIYSLSWDYQGHITSIATDMWSGITAETYSKEFKVYMQCDRIEHGLAAIWKAFYDKYGEPDDK
jgi:hypothetical protein